MLAKTALCNALHNKKAMYNDIVSYTFYNFDISSMVIFNEYGHSTKRTALYATFIIIIIKLL